MDRLLDMPNIRCMSSNITRSMEDYLRTIHSLTAEEGRVRVADIARARGVSMASVCEALHRLDREGLVNYTLGSSGSITLTEKGAGMARRLSSTHGFLLDFLRDLLGVEEDAAERDACAMEHHLSPDTISHLVAFSQFADSMVGGGETLRDAFRRFEVDGGEAPGSFRGRRGRRCATRQGIGLSEIPEGARARVMHLHASCPVRRRLADMGILPGVEVEMIRKAPLGGPVIVALDGFSLSLRRSEAAAVEVEPVA